MNTLTFLKSNAPYLAAGGMMTFMSSFGQTFFISIFAGEIRETFGLSHSAWGGLYMIGTAASAIVMIWAGILTDIFRVRVLGPVVLGGLAAASLLMALNHTLWLLPVAIFLLRIFGQGMCSHIAMVAMSRWFVATRGRAIATATLGFSVGEMILPLSFVALMTVMDWRWLWVVAAGVCLAGIPVLGRLLAQERTPQASAVDTQSLGMLGRQWTRRDALVHPLFWAMVPAILGLSAFGTALFFHQVHIAEVKGLSHVQLVAFFPVYTASAIGAMVLSGVAIDRFGSARLTPFYLVPAVAAFLILAVAQSPMMILAGFFAFALTAGASAGLTNAFWAEFYGTGHLGAIKSLAAAAMVFGSAVGPGLTGLLIDLGYGIEDQFVAIAAYFAAISGLLIWAIGRARPQLDPSAVP